MDARNIEKSGEESLYSGSSRMDAKNVVKLLRSENGDVKSYRYVRRVRERRVEINKK